MSGQAQAEQACSGCSRVLHGDPCMVGSSALEAPCPEIAVATGRIVIVPSAIMTLVMTAFMTRPELIATRSFPVARCRPAMTGIIAMAAKIMALMEPSIAMIQTTATALSSSITTVTKRPIISASWLHLIR